MNPDTLKLLHAMPLFSEFTETELQGLLDLVDEVYFAPGQAIVHQDEKGECMFVMIEGTARVVHRRHGKEVELAVLKAGDFFGELALVDSGPRSADVETLSPCRLLRIDQSALPAVAGVYPNAAFKLLISLGRALVQRMRRGNQKYIDSLLAGQE